MRYAVVIEQADSNYSAYVPDLPGCVATGASVHETEQAIREAIEFHLEGMREDGARFLQPRVASITSRSLLSLSRTGGAGRQLLRRARIRRAPR